MMPDEVTGHVSADDQYGPTPHGAGYEHPDANVGIVVKFLIGLAVAAVIIHLGLGGMFKLFVRERAETTAPRYPLTSSDVTKVPPEPRLQRFPREDLVNFRTGEDELLSTYGWINKGAGTVHIPVEQAMSLVVARGLPVRTPVDLETAMPSDATAGRSALRHPDLPEAVSIAPQTLVPSSAPQVPGPRP
jgi:hypothetical protein